MTNRVQENLAARRDQRLGALLPYLTAGYPDADTTALLIRAADNAGCSVVEIGFPYSDSIADGPVIQSSFHAALASGHRIEHTFSLVEAVRADVGCGLVAMVSHSMVYKFGASAFLQRCRAAGFDGVIIPDAPTDADAKLSQMAADAGLSFIGLVAPTTSPERQRDIASRSSGFVYQIAVSGTTGERQSMEQQLPKQVADLRTATDLPICVGFGISQADQVRHVCSFADGAIVGSALIKRIGDEMKRGANATELVDSVRALMENLMQGANHPRSDFDVN